MVLILSYYIVDDTAMMYNFSPQIYQMDLNSQNRPHSHFNPTFENYLQQQQQHQTQGTLLHQGMEDLLKRE
jgi:hypothetical protein